VEDLIILKTIIASISNTIVDATSGTILFGGIDKSKFTSPLTTINLLPSLISSSVLQFITTITSLSATTNSGEESTIFSGGTDSTAAHGNSDPALAVLLDTGSSAWSLPTQYYEQGILPLFPYVDSQGLCDCKHRDDNDTLTIEFAGQIKITVPARQFIVPVYDPATNSPQYLDSAGTQQACASMLADQMHTEITRILIVSHLTFTKNTADFSLSQNSSILVRRKPEVFPINAAHPNRHNQFFVLDNFPLFSGIFVYQLTQIDFLIFSHFCCDCRVPVYCSHFTIDKGQIDSFELEIMFKVDFEKKKNTNHQIEIR
jgi:hypothetical protein